MILIYSEKIAEESILYTLIVRYIHHVRSRTLNYVRIDPTKTQQDVEKFVIAEIKDLRSFISF